MKTPVLYHLEISHYNEKARWALDYKNVPHIRKAPTPMLHTVRALTLTGKPTLPVLKLNGKAIGDSTRIIEALNILAQFLSGQGDEMAYQQGKIVASFPQWREFDENPFEPII